MFVAQNPHGEGLFLKYTILFSFLLAGALGFWQPAKSGEQQASGANCSFTAQPDKFLSAQSRVRNDIVSRLNRLGPSLKARTAAATVPVSKIPHRNFIDDMIFGQISAAGIPSAALTTDEEFLRRITLDLTGRIPSSDDIRSFEADTTPNKRDLKIEQLLFSPEYVDKWAMWLGDLVGNVSAASNVSVGNGGRDAMYNYLRESVADNIPFRDIAIALINGLGDTSDPVSGGGATFIYRMTTPMGPVQDAFDTSFAKTADIFLGITYYDCLLCHNGSGHLDAINLWGSQITRSQAQEMAAFFSRLNFNMPRSSTDIYNGLYNSWRVLENGTGSYNLNTNYGNRPNRVPLGSVKAFTPVYRNGAAPAAGDVWRDFYSHQVVTDQMFAFNFANRMWKAFFNLGQVDPVDTLDPARLDPTNPPASGWNLQAANPQLFARLAMEAIYQNFKFRDFMRVLVQSSAYQLSSRYDNSWNINDIPLFARHYPRRLDAEEVHDAIAKATGVLGNYTVNGPQAPLIQWAMQLPDPLAPAGGGANLLNVFLRGNRDTVQRSSEASIQQRLTIMNDSFVTSRVKMAASPELQALAKITDTTALINEAFLTFLSRAPADDELAAAQQYFAAATTNTARNSAIEDLAWALINKIDFLYSY